MHNPNLILFGNKADIKKEDWKVTSEEAKNFAVKLNMKYVETSAYTRQGLDEGFSSLINDCSAVPSSICFITFSM